MYFLTPILHTNKIKDGNGEKKFKKYTLRPNYSSTNRLQKYIIIGEKESAEKLVKSVHCPTAVLS